MNPTIEAAMRKYPKAKRIAVENFAGGSEGRGMDMATSMNLSADTACYKWNSHTVSAIKFVFNNKIASVGA
jgi:hypothetical protein